VREFAGFATDGEVTRQRAMLEDALLADGVLYDNLSFKVFQYNPPQTLPWLRRNEVALRIDMTSELQTAYEDMKKKMETTEEPEFYSAPEAGD
jgi:SOUL heme-binding protein